ncbi:MAG: hypothetical protein LBT46_05245 [Planctomycetaceae bacterium]|jgi:hypothetical protein|nr:hypothetical protein [Planctomycetaceae bacterium]
MMHRRLFLSLPAVGAFFSPVLLAQSAEKRQLRYHFRQGKTLRWNVLQTLKMKTIIAGKEEIIETSSRSVKIWKTLEVDSGGNAEFEYSVDDIEMQQKQTGRDDAAYNSRRDKTIPAAFINLQGKVGIPLARIKITPQGKTTKKPLRIYAGSYSENRITILLPEEPVTIGSDWTEPMPKELPMPNRRVKKVKTQQRFTLKNLNNGLASISFVSQILTPLTPQEEVKLADSFSSGEIELDLDAGHLIRQQTTVEKTTVGIQGNSDSINYLARLTECCCGKSACPVCRK